MNDGADFSAIGLDGVEDQMRLEPKAAIARRQVVNCLAYEREIGK
jgi:hypothetical protein